MTNKQTKHDTATRKHEKALQWLRQRTAHAMEENESLFPQVEAMLNKATLNEKTKPLNGKATSTKRKAA